MKNDGLLKELYDYYQNDKFICVFNHLDNHAQPYIAIHTTFIDNMNDSISLYATPYIKNTTNHHRTKTNDKIIISDWGMVDSNLCGYLTNYPKNKSNYKKLEKLRKLYHIQFNSQREFYIIINAKDMRTQNRINVSQKVANLLMFIEDTFAIYSYSYSHRR